MGESAPAGKSWGTSTLGRTCYLATSTFDPKCGKRRVSLAANFMIFGWTDRAKVSGGCTMMVLVLIWGAISVHIEGSSSRYLARFTGWQPPAVQETGPGRMTAEERRVAKALRPLGMPYAEVSTLKGTAANEDGVTVVEIGSRL